MFLNGCAFLYFLYGKAVVSMVTTRKRRSPTHDFFYLMNDEYHLELIIYCKFLYVGGGTCYNGSKMPKNRVFHITLPHPPLVTQYDFTKNHIVFDLYLNCSLLTIMLQHIKTRIKIGVL